MSNLLLTITRNSGEARCAQSSEFESELGLAATLFDNHTLRLKTQTMRAEHAYLTLTCLRMKVGTSKSWPSTIVGSLFSKRPRETGSNCKTSCLAW
jgi:hypothetical protein